MKNYRITDAEGNEVEYEASDMHMLLSVVTGIMGRVEPVKIELISE